MSKKKILIIDDSSFFLSALQGELEKGDYQVLKAKKARAGWVLCLPGDWKV